MLQVDHYNSICDKMRTSMPLAVIGSTLLGILPRSLRVHSLLDGERKPCLVPTPTTMMMHVCTQATNNSKPPFWLVDSRLDCCTSFSSRSEQSNAGYASRARVHTTYAIMNNVKGILVHRVRTEPHQQNVADAVCSPSALANAAAARLTTATIRVRGSDATMQRCKRHHIATR